MGVLDYSNPQPSLGFSRHLSGYKKLSRSSFHIKTAPRGSRDNPDPTLIVTSSRRCKGPSDLLNAEPANESLIDAFKSRRFDIFTYSVAAVEALVDRIDTLSRSLPTTIAAATKQDKIYHAMIPGPSPGRGLQARLPGLGLGLGISEAQARLSQAQARASRPSRARNITTPHAQHPISQLQSSLLLSSLSLIPSDTLRYTLLVIAACLGLVYVVHLKHLSTQLRQLEDLSQTLCVDDSMPPVGNYHSHVDEISPGSRDISICAMNVKKIQTAIQLIVEAEHQRKYTDDINETEIILTSVRLSPAIFNVWSSTGVSVFWKSSLVEELRMYTLLLFTHLMA
ncbi:hypothetical protein FB451DRAFT_1165826 [Mycena latifolia]|nr:hypothetical protein FB451DRAFT_1165826 [Mycena latifolia]